MTGDEAKGTPKLSPWIWPIAKQAADLLNRAYDCDVDGFAADAMTTAGTELFDGLAAGIPADRREAAVLCLSLAADIGTVYATASHASSATDIDCRMVERKCAAAVIGLLRVAHVIAPEDPADRAIFDRLREGAVDLPDDGNTVLGLDYVTGRAFVAGRASSADVSVPTATDKATPRPARLANGGGDG